MRFFGRLAGLFGVLCVLGSHDARAQQSSSRDVLGKRLDSMARGFATGALPVAGMSAVVVRGADTLLNASYGERNRERHFAADRTTIYHLGSLTTTVTAAAILQHVESGRLHLDDTLGALLPQYTKWRRVTIRQLLNHTSGIPSYTASKLWEFLNDNEMSRAEVLYNIERDALDFPPGTQFRAGSTDYFLLGMILERVERKDMLQITAERFFRPLHLRSSSYCPPSPVNSAYAAGYDVAKGQLQLTPSIDMTQLFSIAAVCMSVPDYLAWFSAIADGTLLKPETFARMITSDTLAGRPTGFGLGFSVADLQGHPVIQQAGDMNGFSSVAMWLPKDSVRVVIFANTRHVDVSRLAHSLAVELLR